MMIGGLFHRPLHPQRFAMLAAVTALIGCLLRPAPLIGDSVPLPAAKDYQVTKIRSALELQDTRMNAASLARLAHSINEASYEYSLDPLLVLAIIQVESRFDHKAVSPQGAQGLMQVQPVVVTALVQEGKMAPLENTSKLTDPRVNVKVGTSYLAHLKDLFGDLKVALTAYNFGPTWVSKKIAAKEALPLEYASKVLATRQSLENRLVLKETNFLETTHSQGNG